MFVRFPELAVHTGNVSLHNLFLCHNFVSVNFCQTILQGFNSITLLFFLLNLGKGSGKQEFWSATFYTLYGAYGDSLPASTAQAPTPPTPAPTPTLLLLLLLIEAPSAAPYMGELLLSLTFPDEKLVFKIHTEFNKVGKIYTSWVGY